MLVCDEPTIDEPVTLDKYDKAVAYLTNRPEEIREAWYSPRLHPAGCLFTFVSSDYTSYVSIGCLTTIRLGPHVAETPALTEAIRADKRLPKDLLDITADNLPVFAEWQRRLDRELQRC
jgi:hypothetical protein